MKRLLVIGGCAVLFLTACGGDAGGDNSLSSSETGGGEAALPAPASADKAASSQPNTQQDETRKIIVNSTMQLEVEDLRSAYLNAGQLVRTLGGFVADSNIADTSDDDSTASMRLRVPASRHDELVVALRALGGGRVLKESTTAREVTAQYTDLQSRLRNYQRSEAQYQDLLKQAKTVEEILNVQSRLDSVRGQIEQSQGQLNLYDNQIDFATVSLTLSVPGTPASEGIPGPGEVFTDSWDSAVIAARVILNLVVMVFVAAIWLAIPGLLLFAGIRFTERRRVKPGTAGPSEPPGPE